MRQSQFLGSYVLANYWMKLMRRRGKNACAPLSLICREYWENVLTHDDDDHVDEVVQQRKISHPL